MSDMINNTVEQQTLKSQEDERARRHTVFWFSMSTAKLKTTLYLPAFSSIALYAQIFTSLKKKEEEAYQIV